MQKFVDLGARVNIRHRKCHVWNRRPDLPIRYTSFIGLRSRTCTVQAQRNGIRRCQQHKATQYLTDCVTPASGIAGRQRLRSASRHQLLVPRYQLSSLGRRSFAVAGPTTWNSLSADLRDPTCSDEFFRRSLKTFLFAKY